MNADLPSESQLRRREWLRSHRALYAVFAGLVWGLTSGIAFILLTGAAWPWLVVWVLFGVFLFGPLATRSHLRMLDRVDGQKSVDG